MRKKDIKVFLIIFFSVILLSYSFVFFVNNPVSYLSYKFKMSTYEENCGEYNKINDEYDVIENVDYYSRDGLKISVKKVNDNCIINNNFEYNPEEIEFLQSSFSKYNDFVYSIARDKLLSKFFIYKFDEDLSYIDKQLIKIEGDSCNNCDTSYSIHDGVYYSIKTRGGLNLYKLDENDLKLNCVFHLDKYATFFNSMKFKYGEKYKNSFIINNKTFFEFGNFVFVNDNGEIKKYIDKEVLKIDFVTDESCVLYTYEIVDHIIKINKYINDEVQFSVEIDDGKYGVLGNHIFFMGDKICFSSIHYMTQFLSTLPLYNLFVVDDFGNIKVVSHKSIKSKIFDVNKINDNQIIFTGGNDVKILYKF